MVKKILKNELGQTLAQSIKSMNDNMNMTEDLAKELSVLEAKHFNITPEEFLKKAKSEKKKAGEEFLKRITKKTATKKKVVKKKTETKSKAEKISKEINKRIKPDVDDFLTFSEKWNCYFVKVDDFAKYLIHKSRFRTIFGKKTETIWAFDDKIYRNNGREIVKTQSEEILGTHCKNKVVSEILEKVKRMTNFPPELFDKNDIDLIPCENGVYNVKTKKLEEHHWKNNFKFIMPVVYDPEAKCETFDKFIKETLYPDDIPTIQEWFGYCLRRDYFIKKGMIFFGDTDTGKTTLLEVLISFVGEKNKTGLALQKLASNNDFVKLSLKDKLLNAYDDLSSKDLSDGGNFKIATGDGHISAEEKFGEYVQFKNHAKHTFCANKIPPVQDNEDKAYFGRWIPVAFDNVPDKQDPFLKEKLRTPEELSGILNWSLIGLQRLLKNGKFTFQKTPDEIKSIMERSGSPLVNFVEEVLIEEEGNRISKEEMFEIYTIYAKEFEQPRLSKEQLGRRLENHAKFIISKVGKGKEGRYWLNAGIKKEFKECLENSKKQGEPETNEGKSTLSTLSKYTREKPYSSIGIDIVKKEVSKVSNDKKEEVVPVSEQEEKEIMGDFE